MTIEEAKKSLFELEQKIRAYDHATALIYYDGVTSAPKGTAANRGVALGILAEEQYKLKTCESTVRLLSFLEENSDSLNEEENRRVFLLSKDLKKMSRIPVEEYVAYQQLLNDADDIWHRAKETSDFALFEPVLKKIFDTNIRFAGLIEPEKAPYDYMLSEFEDGLDTAACDRFFDALKKRLIPLIKKVSALPKPSRAVLEGEFPADRQEEFAHLLMNTIGLDPEHVGLATTEHPFTINFGSHLDERITTNYVKDDYSSSMFSVIHEGGHALYDTGSKDEYAGLALDGGVSMGVHESQSRFYENILGRSRAFAEYIFPYVCRFFPSAARYSAEDFYRAINIVEPSLIRTNADEVTYSLHVLIRYELEKAVVTGSLEVRDLPREWNRLYKEYLGIDVPDDRHGVLQDSHWSGGGIGYFPSYSLGSAYGAQFLAKMKESVDVDACIKKGDFAPVNEWNRSRIWQYGSLYTPAELLRKVLGEDFDPSYYLDYLENKVRDVYGIKE